MYWRRFNQSRRSLKFEFGRENPASETSLERSVQVFFLFLLIHLHLPCRLPSKNITFNLLIISFLQYFENER